MAGPSEPANRRPTRVKLDAVTAAAVDLAREAALASSGTHAVGEHLGVIAEADRVVTHLFDCTHPGYRGWRWNVTLVRAARAKVPTVNEVALMPGEDALLAPSWVPWSERISAEDVTPGMLMPTPAEDERLEPGYTGGDRAADRDPAEAAQTRAVVAELGLGRERVLSAYGRGETAERWLAGDGGPHNQMTKQAPGPCVTCGYFIRLEGSLGTIFGVCANEMSPSDGTVVAVDHGCGAHSDVTVDDHAADRSAPIWDTISVSEGSLFD
ncbi:Protein of unknown function [Raineyella antarctica]|uniref:DUF3027 domain-containing protein n=2 Tax=Raineyella antarctica TaxID=1577474 RepID=A0A1G6GEQ9_9ACTN|nr:DUF3027 domain-containing protein [Raineyella antarctica]SDB80323.1 Protein of unknown function [Raineyella antarctica]